MRWVQLKQQMQPCSNSSRCSSSRGCSTAAGAADAAAAAAGQAARAAATAPRRQRRRQRLVRAWCVLHGAWCVERGAYGCTDTVVIFFLSTACVICGRLTNRDFKAHDLTDTQPNLLRATGTQTGGCQYHVCDAQQSYLIISNTKSITRQGTRG